MDKLISWHRDFYQQRDFEPNDSVPLYKLRANFEEFEALTSILKAFVSEKTPYMSVNCIIDSCPLFNKLFVLYAAEWWKRKYSGGHWTWKHIIDDLGIEEDDISPQKRSVCVSRGLSRWNLKIADTSGKRFLGAIAIQGGLPLHFLTSQEGNIYRVLERLVKHAEGAEVSSSRLETWAEELQYFLPHTYRKKEIYALLAQVVEVLFNIKRNASDQTNKAILAEWRSNHSKWLTELPITAPYEEVDRLISKLLGVVAATNEKRTISDEFLTIRRNLIINDEGGLTCKGVIEVAGTISAEQLLNKFKYTVPENKPSLLNVQLSIGSYDEHLTLHSVVGDSTYSSSVKSVQIREEAFFDQIIFELQTTDGVQSAVTGKRGEAIGREQPVLFELTSDDSDEYEYIGQGSKNTKAETLLMLLDPEAVVETENSRVLGLFKGYKAVIVETSTFVKQNGNRYRIKVNSTLNEEFYLVGKQVDWISQRSTQVYRGIPTVFHKKNDTARPINSKLKFTVGRNQNEAKRNIIGLVKLTYEENGTHLWSQKIMVIDEHSSEEFDYKASTVKFKGWGNVNINGMGEEVSLEKVNSAENQWKFVLSGITYPAYVNTWFSWSITDGGARIELPIPYKGIQLLNSKDVQVPSETLIALNKLYGYRLRVYPGDEKFFQVLFELSSNQAVKQSYKMDVMLNGDERQRIFRLNDFKAKFQELLSLTSGLDDTIKVTVVLRGHRRVKFYISQYDIQTVPSNRGLRLNQHNNASSADEKPVILAQIIHQPGVQQMEVPVLDDYELDLGVLEIGIPWLVYPSEDSEVSTRPAFWSGSATVTMPLEDLSELSKAMVIAEKEERCRAIAAALEIMTHDLEADSWGTFNGLVSEFGHLPLSALDVWSVATQNHDFMALLALGAAEMPPGFVERFANELPFMFYFIPVSAWENAFKLTLGKVREAFNDNDSLFLQVLEKHFALEVWTKKEIFNLIGVSCKHAFDLDYSGIDSTNESILNYLVGNDLQRLRNIHCDDDWPGDEVMLRIINKQIGKGQSLFTNQGKMSLVYNLPVLLGYHVMYPDEINLKFTPRVVSVIREVKRFDQNWFSNMFNYTIAWNYLKEKSS